MMGDSTRCGPAAGDTYDHVRPGYLRFTCCWPSRLIYGTLILNVTLSFSHITKLLQSFPAESTPNVYRSTYVLIFMHLVI